MLKGTGWLIDREHIVTAGHVLGRMDPLANIQVQFPDEAPQPATRIAWKFDETTAVDCAVIKLAKPTTRPPLAVSLAKTVTSWLLGAL